MYLVHKYKDDFSAICPVSLTWSWEAQTVLFPYFASISVEHFAYERRLSVKSVHF